MVQPLLQEVRDHAAGSKPIHRSRDRRSCEIARDPAGSWLRGLLENRSEVIAMARIAKHVLGRCRDGRASLPRSDPTHIEPDTTGHSARRFVARRSSCRSPRSELSSTSTTSSLW